MSVFVYVDYPAVYLNLLYKKTAIIRVRVSANKGVAHTPVTPKNLGKTISPNIIRTRPLRNVIRDESPEYSTA